MATMTRSPEERARERRNYVEQARASFRGQQQGYYQEPAQEGQDSEAGGSALGVRLVIAAFLFACFVYFEQEDINVSGIGTQEIVRQIEWNPVPAETLPDLLGEIGISGAQEEPK